MKRILLVAAGIASAGGVAAPSGDGLAGKPVLQATRFPVRCRTRQAAVSSLTTAVGPEGPAGHAEPGGDRGKTKVLAGQPDMPGPPMIMGGMEPARRAVRTIHGGLPRHGPSRILTITIAAFLVAVARQERPGLASDRSGSAGPAGCRRATRGHPPPRLGRAGSTPRAGRAADEPRPLRRWSARSHRGLVLRTSSAIAGGWSAKAGRRPAGGGMTSRNWTDTTLAVESRAAAAQPNSMPSRRRRRGRVGTTRPELDLGSDQVRVKILDAGGRGRCIRRSRGLSDRKFHPGQRRALGVCSRRRTEEGFFQATPCGCRDPVRAGATQDCARFNGQVWMPEGQT